MARNDESAPERKTRSRLRRNLLRRCLVIVALKRGVPVRAAVVIAGVSDLEAFGRYRPEFVNGDDTYDGWAKVWPDYAHRAAEHYHERSAVQWADKLTVPILILHRRSDRLVPVDQALRMAAALQSEGCKYALHVYANWRPTDIAAWGCSFLSIRISGPVKLMKIT